MLDEIVRNRRERYVSKDMFTNHIYIYIYIYICKKKMWH